MFGIAIGTDVKKAAGIDSESFAALYEQFMPRVYRYVSFRIKDVNMAQDLTSMVFEKALTKYHSFNPQKASFSTWIFTIARNTVIDHYRVGRKDEYLQPETRTYASVQFPSPEDAAIKSENTRRLRSFLSRLSKREQEIVTLKFSNGMTNREISTVLHISESNVGSILCRTVHKLRDSLARWQNE